MEFPRGTKAIKKKKKNKKTVTLTKIRLNNDLIIVCVAASGTIQL